MSQAKAAYAKPPGDVADMKRVAERLEQDHPWWIVVFGGYSLKFVAFPRFPAPGGTVVTASHPDDLPGRMRAVEGWALPRPAVSAAPASHAVLRPDQGEGRSGDVAGR